MKIEKVNSSGRADGINGKGNIPVLDQIRANDTDSSLHAIEELKPYPNWVGYKLVERRRSDGSIRVDKMPVNPHDGRAASTADSITWGVHEQVEVSIYQYGLDGFGWVFCPELDYSGVDIDNCVDNDGVINPEARALIKQLNSYTEYSPSGNGIHILVKGTIPHALIDHDTGLEIYSTGRFFTVTGDHVSGTPTTIEERQDELDETYNRHTPERASSTSTPGKNGRNASVNTVLVPTPEDIREALSFIPKQTDYGECWLRVLMAVHSVFPNNIGVDLIEEWSPGYEGEVPRKFASFSQDGNSNGRVTIATLFHIAKEHGWKSTGEVSQSEPKFNIQRYHAEDGGILDSWEEEYGDDWLYDNSTDRWLNWSGTHWNPDYDRAIHRQMQDLVKRMNDAAREMRRAATDDEQVRIAKGYISATKRSRNRINSVIEMAKARKAIGPSKLDQGNLLNLVNGTVDLETLEFREHRREDLLSHRLDFEYDPSAICPLWERFISEVLVDATTLEADIELADFVQEAVGYTITNSTNAEIMFWLYGLGSNGKSVLTTTLQRILGPLAIVTNFHHWGKSGNYDIACLPGKRLVLSTECEQGGHLDESLIRRIVSGERIPARAIYGRPFEFKPVAKLWWAMNHRPAIKENVYATWRRLRLIPFNRTFTEADRDPDLTVKLMAELTGILNWALEGLKRYRRQGGFTPARSACVALDQYRSEANPLLVWFDETVEIVDQCRTPAASLYKSYRDWCRRMNEEPLTRTIFGRKIKELPGVIDKRSNGVKYNLRLRGD